MPVQLELLCSVMKMTYIHKIVSSWQRTPTPRVSDVISYKFEYKFKICRVLITGCHIRQTVYDFSSQVGYFPPSLKYKQS